MTGQAEKTDASEGFFAQIFARWREQMELSQMPHAELGRMAHELGLSSDELRSLAAKGPHAADLLYERMQALGVSRTDVDRLGWNLMRDLEKTCACCGDKGQCRADLAAHPDSPAWKEYCPNAMSLEAIRRTKGRGML